MEKFFNLTLEFSCSLFKESVKYVYPARCKNIRGQIALVTGAGRGLGKEIALELAEQGCKVIVVDINLDNVKQTAEEIVDTGGKAFAFKCDISKAEEVVELQQMVEGSVGPVDILVNNAAIIYIQTFGDNSLSEIERVISVNVTGLINMTHVFLKGMVARKKGHIVTIASSAAYYPIPWAVVYSTTKSAGLAFMNWLQEQLRYDQHEDYIKTTCVLPTILNTPSVQGFKYLTEFLDARIAAKQTVEAMRKNKTTVTIPWALMFVLKFWTILPKWIQWFIREKIFNEWKYIGRINSAEV